MESVVIVSIIITTVLFFMFSISALMYVTDAFGKWIETTFKLSSVLFFIGIRVSMVLSIIWFFLSVIQHIF